GATPEVRLGGDAGVGGDASTRPGREVAAGVASRCTAGRRLTPGGRAGPSPGRRGGSDGDGPRVGATGIGSTDVAATVTAATSGIGSGSAWWPPSTPTGSEPADTGAASNL